MFARGDSSTSVVITQPSASDFSRSLLVEYAGYGKAGMDRPANFNHLLHSLAMPGQLNIPQHINAIV